VNFFLFENQQHCRFEKTISEPVYYFQIIALSIAVAFMTTELWIIRDALAEASKERVIFKYFVCERIKLTMEQKGTFNQTFTFTSIESK
jgi:hypothetical protein